MYDTLDCVKVVVHVQKRMCELMGVNVLLYALVSLHIAIAGPLTMPTNSCTLLYIQLLRAKHLYGNTDISCRVP